MPVIYPEGGMPGMLLKQRRAVKPAVIDTFKVQLVPLRAAPKAKIGGPVDVVRLVREMEDYDRETSKIIHLDTKNQVMGVETISIGSLSASIVHPRETVKGAILNNSANVIFVHNHPSGICEPSNEDVEISGKLKEAFETVGIALLDSMIVGKGCYYSLREVGFISGKPEPVITSGTVAEPKASQETKDKVDFITAMTEYITAPDLIRRKRAAEKIQVSKYFKPWFDEFFYEHDRESAKRKLMKFFVANEQGLQFVNYVYYGVLTEYLNAIAKPVLEVRENTVPLVQHIKQEIKAIHALATANDPSATRRAENTIKWIDSGVTAKIIMQEQANTLKDAVKKALYKVPYLEIAKLIGEAQIVTAEPLVLKTEKLGTMYLSYVQLGKEVYSEWGATPEEAVRNAKAKAERQTKLGSPRAEVEIKHEPGKIFPWRVVYAGTDKTVQTRQYPEAMAYYTELEAERGITEEGLTLVPGIPKKPPLENVINSGGTVVDDYGFTWRPVKAPKTKLYLYISVLTEYSGETVGFYEYKFAGWKEKLKKLAEAREKTSFPKRPGTVSENIQTINNIEVFLNRLTVDTSRYSRAVPTPESQVIGAAIPEDGFLFGYHVTDNPEEVMRKLRSNIPLCQLNPEGDLGCGFYVSGVPQYWFVRSREKWEFARNLTRVQRQALVNVILSDPKYKKGGGYLADFEVDYLNRDLKQFVETGDVNLLAMTGNQPYNVRITEEIARKAGVPVPKLPRMIKVKLQGKFINAAELYSNPEVVNRAQAWAVINRPKLLEWNKRASTQDIVNAWLCSMGYCGAFTKSGVSTNPEMAIWDRKAIIGAWIPEPQT